jgi:hypothetical protein
MLFLITNAAASNRECTFNLESLRTQRGDYLTSVVSLRAGDVEATLACRPFAVGRAVATVPGGVGFEGVGPGRWAARGARPLSRSVLKIARSCHGVFFWLRVVL